MIIRRETLNEISTMYFEGYTVNAIAYYLNLAVADVRDAIKAFKL